MAFAIWSAVFFPLLKAKIDGPEPEIPEPKAPFSRAVCLIKNAMSRFTLERHLKIRLAPSAHSSQAAHPPDDG